MAEKKYLVLGIFGKISPHFPIRYAIGTGFPEILRDRLPAILRGKPKEREFMLVVDLKILVTQLQIAAGSPVINCAMGKMGMVIQSGSSQITVWTGWDLQSHPYILTNL